MTTKRKQAVTRNAVLGVLGIAACMCLGLSIRGRGRSAVSSPPPDIGQAVLAENEAAVCPLDGRVTMAGSTSMERLANALGESFMAKYPHVAVTTEFTGSSAGIEAVLAGRAHIGNVSRALTEEEKAAGAVENIVAVEGIAVVVDSDNVVEGLTSEQLIDLYTGRVRNWKEAGGRDVPVVVLGREAGSGTRETFEKMFGIEYMCAYANELNSSGAVMARTASTSGAIGYVSRDVLDGSVRALSIDGCAPTDEDICEGSYLLSRPLIMATKGAVSEQDREVREFFAFLYSEEGRRVIESVGLIVPKRVGVR